MNVSAISADATLCMQSKGKGWGAYSSLPEAINALRTTYTSHSCRKLTFKAYFSSSDMMIGKGGQQYFEDCWKQGNSQGDVEIVVKTVPDTDHDSVILPEKGCIEEVFAAVRRVMS